ncbi:MAG: efflux transporter outer membrane subunit [Candidatus Omnitrophica bacterium]|nr:efflux transporter outer membrane subunit [Candidatus Omnitrophota bacterium]
MKSILMSFMVFLFLTGCALVGDDYTRPEVRLPKNWEHSSDYRYWKEADPQDHQSKGAWWEIFDDKILNALQEKALNYNHDLKSAMANVRKARALARIDKASFLPTIMMSPEFERSRTTRNSLNSTSASANSFISERYEIPFDLTYEIDLWGRVRRIYEAGVAQAEATVAEYYTVMLTLNADVARHYFQLLELDKEIAVIDETIKLREYAVEVVEERVKGGVTSELDLNRAKTELAKVQADRVEIVRQRQEIENALAVLCGQLPSEFSVDYHPLDLSVPNVPLNMPSELLERRPDIAQAERSVASANANIGVAQGALFPKISLAATGGFKSVELSSLGNWESRFWSLGPNVSIPLFTGGKGKANIQAAEAEYDQTVEDYRQTVLKAIEEVETAMSNIRQLEKQSTVLQEILLSSRQTAELSIFRYKEGLVTFLEVIDAERSRLDAELQTTRVANQRLISAIQLIKALGGSWGEDPQPPFYNRRTMRF